MFVYFFRSLGDAIKLRKTTYIKFDFIKTHFHIHILTSGSTLKVEGVKC